MKAYWVDTSPKITVYMVQADGLCGPVVWDLLEDALEEVKSHLEEFPVKKVTIETREMSQQDFDDLEEFEGY